MKDNVKCMNCDFDDLVSTGEETCPQCHEEGYLAWKDEEPQEVDDD